MENYKSIEADKIRKLEEIARNKLINEGAKVLDENNFNGYLYKDVNVDGKLFRKVYEPSGDGSYLLRNSFCL